MRAVVTAAVLLAARFAMLGERIAAQEPAAVAPGMRVRVAVSQPGAPRYVGIHHALTPDTLALQVENRLLVHAPVAIPVASIRGLEVSRARGFCTGIRVVCMAAGGAAGIAAGVVVADAVHGDLGGSDIGPGIGLFTIPVGFFAGIAVGGDR